MPHDLVALLIWVIVIFVLVVVACMVVDRTMPGEFALPAKLVIGLLALVALLSRLLPMF